MGGLVALVVLAGCSYDPVPLTAAPRPKSKTPILAVDPVPVPVAVTVTTGAPPTTAPPATAPPTTVPTIAPAPAAPATTLPVPPVPVDGLAPGMEGDEVRALQERLVTLHYDPGAVDGRYGRALSLAVMAFQKLNGLPRTGKATSAVLGNLAAATDPAPMLPDGGATRVEIDFARQVLFFWRDGALVRILPVSTGNGKRYCAEGGCGVAVTPSGSFRVERRLRGLRKSRLGVLYDPLYFHGGYAIHGSPSVPARPASHGCVRIPLHVSRWFYDNVPDRTPVYLIGGKRPAVPLPPEPPPAPAEPAPAPAEPAPAPPPEPPVSETPA